MTLHPTSRFRRRVALFSLAAIVVSAPGLAIGAPGLALGATASHRIGDRAATRANAPARDLAVYGSGDSNGYHLYLASAASGTHWRPLATIAPGGQTDQRWIGQQCLTGDGRTVVAVVAPWSANNSEPGMDAGALAYAVNVRTGAVRPLAAGVSLAYFDPGCDADGTVALTSYLGTGQRPTRVSVLDAASGHPIRAATVRAEVTSAVSAGGQILAAEGGDLVKLTTGSLVVLHRFTGQVASLHPSAGGGLDMTVLAGARRMEVWHYSPASRARLLAWGSPSELRLFGGANGRNIVANARYLARSAGLTAVRLPGAAAPLSASSGGGLLQVADTRAPLRAAYAGDNAVAVWRPGASGIARVRLPAAAVRGTLAMPARSLAAPAFIPRPIAAPGRQHFAGPSTYTPNQSIPQCAVPRNDIFKQVWQPGSDQVRWAVDQAALNALADADNPIARPTQNWHYTVNDGSYSPLPTLYPSTTWPLANLVPGSSPAVTVPPLVMFGILAQESNWDQASWHAVPGRSGNPLISDYYGTSNPKNPNPGQIDYNYADCGYGIAQITDGMQNPNYPGAQSPLPAATQIAIAVDYATNIADAESILQSKWDQLKSLGITMNNGDPTKIENWYGAIWAYNSGVHTGGPQNNGLGWFNNPANPIYPFGRHTFLHQGTIVTTGDAANPQDWPYQEKVFGWMEVPLTFGGVLDYRGTYDWDTGAGSFLNTPGSATFCLPNVNNCSPGNIGNSDPCPAENNLCWWDAPVRWVSDNCASSCITDTATVAPNNHVYYDQPGEPEPTDPPLSATCTLGANTPVTDSSGNLLAGTIIVNDEMIPGQNPTGLTPNLMDCPDNNSALVPPASANASFSLLGQNDVPIDSANSPGQAAAIDLHQLGGGLGGQMFFTHTGSGLSNEARGQWQATLPTSVPNGTVYQIYAFVPDIAASAGDATYEVDTDQTPGNENSLMTNLAGRTIMARTISQANYTNQWVSLGYYLCGGYVGAQGSTSGSDYCPVTVTLRSATPSNDSTQGADLGFGPIAFVPAPTGAYVALGDSISSGEGLFSGYDDGSDVSTQAPGDSGANGDLCHRSSLSWPRLLAAAKGWPIIDLACSGSNLGDLVGAAPGGQYYFDESTSKNTGLPFGYITKILNDGSLVTTDQTGYTSSMQPNPENAGSAFFGESSAQLDLLRALHPKVVTLTIGGNDLGFADIFTTCIFQQPCQQWFANSSGPDQLSKRITSLEPLLQQAYADVKAAAGTSNVYVLTYPSPIAYDSGQAGNSSDCTYMLNSDRQWLLSKQPALTNAIITAANAAGIHYIDISSLFNNHGACSGTPYANQPDLPVPLSCNTESCIDNFFHPNKFGYQAIEKAVVSKITF